MKPVAFRYERPESVEEAVSLLAEHGDEAKVLAGGQSLVPVLNMRLLRPSVVLDINRVLDLDNIARDNGAFRVSALVRQSDARLLEVPLLRDCLPHVGHFVTRNRGTVCGSVVHADAAAELPLALTLLGGSVVAASARGRREIAAADFYVTHFTTHLGLTSSSSKRCGRLTVTAGATRSRSWRSGMATSPCAWRAPPPAARSCASPWAPSSTGRR